MDKVWIVTVTSVVFALIGYFISVPINLREGVSQLTNSLVLGSIAVTSVPKAMRSEKGTLSFFIGGLIAIAIRWVEEKCSKTQNRRELILLITDIIYLSLLLGTDIPETFFCTVLLNLSLTIAKLGGRLKTLSKLEGFISLVCIASLTSICYTLGSLSNNVFDIISGANLWSAGYEVIESSKQTSTDSNIDATLVFIAFGVVLASEWF